MTATTAFDPPLGIARAAAPSPVPLPLAGALRMKFALMIYQPHPFDPKALGEAEYGQVAADYAAVNATPGVTPGPAMGFAAKATTVRVKDGEAIAAPGPYAGEAHAVGGCLVLQAASLEDAVALAARIPAARLGGAVEIRPCEAYW